MQFYIAVTRAQHGEVFGQKCRGRARLCLRRQRQPESYCQKNDDFH